MQKKALRVVRLTGFHHSPKLINHYVKTINLSKQSIYLYFLINDIAFEASEITT